MTKTKDRPVATFDRLQKKKPRTLRRQLCLDEDLVLEVQQARAELFTAKRTNPDGVAAAEATLAEVQERYDEASVKLVFRALGRSAYAALQAQHPATEADHAEMAEATGNPKARAAVHGDTFGPALIAASCVEPKMSPDQVRLLRDGNGLDPDDDNFDPGWNDAEFAVLWDLAVQANTQQSSAGPLVFR